MLPVQSPMGDPSHPWRDAVSPSVLARVDKICDRFEEAWIRAQSTSDRPRIADFLADTSQQEHSVLLYELIDLDIHYRRQAGEQPSARDYQTPFPFLDLAPLANSLTDPDAAVSGSQQDSFAVKSTQLGPGDAPPV